MFEDILRELAELPYPERHTMKFIEELREPRPIYVSNAPPKSFERGICIAETEIPATALESLRRILKLCGIPEVSTGIPLRTVMKAEFVREEFSLEISAAEIIIGAAEPEGTRGAVYELEDRLLSGGDMEGFIHRKPYIKNRISRCFHTPISRPPNYLDELTDDVDYYTDAYLDRLAHERINGLWVTVYLNDFPSTVFPTHGDRVEMRLEKLRRIVRQCARYGIKCYLFMSEPKSFSPLYKAFSPEDERCASETMGHRRPNGFRSFCTSSPKGQTFLRETIEYIFSRVSGLGGIINIMCLEGADPCGTWRIYDRLDPCNCSRCAQRDAAAIFRETALLMRDAMRRWEPEAEFIGWFYFGWFLAGDPEEKQFLEIAEGWPSDIPIMFNFETGGIEMQLGKPRPVLDYSLSYVGPAQLWLEVARRAGRSGAKLQVSNSHEDASVPLIPVPGNLFRKYDAIHRSSCDTVMQCWYFGNYPGLMNRAAGRLSFLPFPNSEDDFLRELAYPQWREAPAKIVEAWKYFGEAYRLCPENISFKWVGVLHFSIIFPWYIFPVDAPMMMSYVQGFPKIAGDRIGECIDFAHNRLEAAELLRQMEVRWQRGFKVMKSIETTDPECIREIGLAECIGIQIASSRRFFEFYLLREKMIMEQIDLRPEMVRLVQDEIIDTRRMQTLCEQDSRLGYHSETEGYLFFPAKLQKRAESLEALLNEEFPRFDFRLPEVREYAGDAVWLEYLHCPAYPEFSPAQKIGEAEFRVTMMMKHILVFELRNVKNDFLVELETVRLSSIKYYSMRSGVLGDEGIGKTAELQHANGVFTLRVDLRRFPEPRPDDAPVRFNVSCDGQSFRQRNPLPPRLCCGTCNPTDLFWMKF